MKNNKQQLCDILLIISLIDCAVQLEFHPAKMSANQSFSDLTKEQQEELKKSEREHQEHLKRLAELYRQNNKNKSSAAIGGAGEELVKKVIEKAQCFALSDVRKEAHKGDFVISKLSPTKLQEEGIKVMVEVKAHSKPVPTKEQTKFWNDLKVNKAYKAGVFIAVNAPIAYVPKNEVPCVRFSEKGDKVGLFIQNLRDFSNEEQVLALKVAFD